MISEPHIQTPNTTTPTGLCIIPNCQWKGNKKCRSKKCQRCCTDTECREHTKQAKRTSTIQRNRQQMMTRTTNTSQLLREATPVIVSQHIIPAVRPEQFAQVVNEVRRLRTQLQILSQTPQPPNSTTIATSIISQTEMRQLPPEQRDAIIDAHEIMTQSRDIAYSSFINVQAEKQGVQFLTPKENPQPVTTTEVTKEPMLKCYLCLEEVAIKECVAPHLCGHLLCRGCSKELMTPFEHKDWMGMVVQSVGFKCPICSKISTSMTPLFTN